MNRVWLVAPLLALAVSGCATEAPVVARVVPQSDAQVVSGVCAALNEGDAQRASELVGDRPIAPVLKGMARVCPQQIERMRRAADNESSSGESQLDYYCAQVPDAHECKK